jgi:hypothetical protein
MSRQRQPTRIAVIPLAAMFHLKPAGEIRSGQPVEDRPRAQRDPGEPGKTSDPNEHDFHRSSSLVFLSIG